MKNRTPFTQLIFKKMYHFLLLTLLVFTTSSAQANSATQRYSIEVVVFESLALKGWTEEYWPEEFERPTIENSTSVYSQGKKPLLIYKSSNTLSGAVATLNKRGYRVLFHQAWSQIAYANKKAPTVLIENNQAVGTSMLGTVRLYKTRYAHVDIDLEFEKNIPNKILEAFIQNQKINSAEAPNTWRFQLKESRKIKPGELHYIDHPLFGALIKIEQIGN